ncbi:SDR family NAD(P)-dependent oxidoreductase [Hymenobacter cellulosivorans]|uniref:SDR family NAD(P)-dependent oxidoreductase n=1 Tax=Hymenobacter cellulosivorans TaxID=2932249 RepID=A0ABY4F755_9BACT|nr:SDR family NAD(P)-dependent oxidoreductase [Hymenobacter cellulosivorans]UOQ51749.1 SDR family NAD(P)-dependent oxidoreductase [Hymenobacter cellulosivorans]
MKFTNKTVLITGGGTGIGLALAQLLAQRRNHVIIIGRRLDKLQEAQQLTPELEIFQCDVADPAAIDALFASLQAQGIVLDALINNAAVLEMWDILEQPLPSAEIFNRVSINLAAPICLTQRFVRQADRKRTNYIVNVTSEAAIMPVPVLPLYSASKTGLSVFTQSLRVQLKNHPFVVMEVMPPPVESRMTTQDLRNSGPLVLPTDFALGLVKQLEAGKLDYAPGANAWQLGLIRRLAPKMGLHLVDKLSRQQLHTV